MIGKGAQVGKVTFCRLNDRSVSKYCFAACRGCSVRMPLHARFSIDTIGILRLRESIRVRESAHSAQDDIWPVRLCDNSQALEYFHET
jgi:hypothetical protein